MSTFQTIQDLYDRHLYLQAFHQSAPYWSAATDVEGLSVEELLLGGRLAARLGGLRLSRRLFMLANAREPDSPAVRYFTMHCRRRGDHLFDILREFQRLPDLDVEDWRLRASWLGTQSVIWASIHDFDRAHDCIERAYSLGVDHPWTLSCESEIWGHEDRWDKAFEAAERAWEMDFRAPHVIRCLGNSLMHLGRAREAAERLWDSAQEGESFDVAHQACWCLCAAAEVLEGDDRGVMLERARHLADGLLSLAPLADRETRSLCARIELDIAEQKNDREGIQRWAEEIRSPFHRLMIENFHRNPEGQRIVLPFNRVAQRYNECLPASLSVVLSAMGIELSPDEIARDITYGGTSFWAAAEWLERRGLVVRFFIVTPEVATRLLHSSLPFVMGVEWEGSGHAVAVVGFDEAASTLLVHDPSAFRSHYYLLDFIQEEEGPLGPRGMAVVPADQADWLDALIPQEEIDVAAAYERHQREREKGGPVAARRVLSHLLERHASHVVTRYLKSVQCLEDGNAGEALSGFQDLLLQHPRCLRFREGVLWACNTLGNTALMRETLEGVVERGTLPGVQSGQEWRYPPIAYVSHYADEMRVSGLLRQKAHRKLMSALKRQYSNAEAWHVLGDLLWHERDEEGMLLAYRIASCLQETNEHYASSYCGAVRHAGREKEGMSWLEARVNRLGSSPRGSGPWMTWIGALEDYGYPERATSACEEALLHHEDSPELLTFAVSFFARMGMWDRSQICLGRLEENENRPLFMAAAVGFHRMRGDLGTSIGLCEAWVEESPHSLQARQQYLELLAARDGQRAAIERAAEWALEWPGHDRLEELHYQWLGVVHDDDAQNKLLVARVKRNNHDGWAWRELACRRIWEFERSDEPRRTELQPLIQKLLAQCHRTAPNEAATIRVKNFWLEARGMWGQAMQSWLKLVDREPDDFIAYRRAWECAAALGHDERRLAFERMEEALLRCPERLSLAHDLIALVADRFGLAEAERAVERWRKARPDDPDLVEAEASLLLEWGHGRTDAGRALMLLEPGVERYPRHTGLRFSLAQAYRMLGRTEDADLVFEEIVHRHPDNCRALVRLAWIKERRGEPEAAQELLERAASVAPLDPETWYYRTRWLIRRERYVDAVSVVRQGLARLPENVQWREMAIDLLQECGDEAGAVDAARQGVEIHPRGSYLWYLLANTLNRLRRFAAPGEIEACARKALAFNAGLLEAADGLAMLLVEQCRYQEAAQAVRQIIPRLSDPSLARGRLAWILREQGKKRDAFDEMASILQSTPSFRWGWDCLMDWMLEGEDWNEARRLLASIPPEMHTQTKFRRRRLTVLAAAGMPEDRLDDEWKQLLSDFPEDVDLHLERFDQLQQCGRTEESASILKSIRTVAPDSPYVLARLVDVLAGEGLREQVLDVFLRIGFAEVEESGWPVHRAWSALGKAGLQEQAYLRARQKLVEGERPTHSALKIMAEYAMRDDADRQGKPRQSWREWFPSRGAREVLALLDLVNRTAWADPAYRAELFITLCSHHYYRPLLKYWKEKPLEVDSDPECWGYVGLVLSDLRSRRSREFLANWRQRAGVGMWVVANYVLCFNRHKKSDRLEILSACRDALTILPHDHAAKGLAHLLAEMCAVTGDIEGFRETWSRYRLYFTGRMEEGEWLEKEHSHLLTEIPRLGTLLDQNDLEGFREGARALEKQHSSKLSWPEFHLHPGQAAFRAGVAVFVLMMLKVVLRLASFM